MCGQADVREFWRSALSVSSAQYGEIDEVLECDDRVIAVMVTWRGIARDTGGVFALPVGNVSVIEAGRNVSQDQYDPGDRDAMLACYVELGGRRGVLGDRPPERWLARWIERYTSHDRDGLRELWARDCVFIDHREMAWEELRGRQALLAVTESTWEVVPNNRV